jgi:hypothetical protein
MLPGLVAKVHKYGLIPLPKLEAVEDLSAVRQDLQAIACLR